VLVVDSAPHPGGTAYVYRRGDFLFPMGPLGCANPELVRETLFRAELEGSPSFRRVHYGLRAAEYVLKGFGPVEDMELAGTWKITGPGKGQALFPSRDRTSCRLIRRKRDKAVDFVDMNAGLPGYGSTDRQPEGKGPLPGFHRG
jgi:hypothetical protein